MKYYQKLTLLFCLMFGFIGIQRVIIAVIMPTIQKDLGFSYLQQGMIVAITGLTWALGTIVFAAIGDKYGRRPVIAVCTILSGVFSWVTGLVHNVGQLMAIRGFLGLFEGGPYPLSMGTISEEAPPHRRAMNAGLVTGSFMLIGICIGSQIAVWLLEKFGSWRPVFYVVSIPAVIVGVLIFIVMRETPSVAETIRLRKEGKKVSTKSDEGVSVRTALKYKNVLLSSINSIPVMGWLYVFTTFSSSFLVTVHKLDMFSIGLIISASGLGGFLGESILGSVSDVIGRKKALIFSALLCALFGIAVAMTPIGETSTLVFGILFFFYGFFGGGMYPTFLSTLPAESVPPRISGTAVAIPTAIGETLGAALMPTIAGKLGDMFSLYAPMWMAALAGIFIAFISIFYIETSPRCVAKMKHKPTQEDHLLKRFRQEARKEAVAAE